MSNTITAFFKGRVGVAEAVYQNDYGLVMNLDSIELPAHFDCYFSTLEQDEAIPGIGADNQVAIPNDCLTRAGSVMLHIPLHTGANDSEVEYVVYFKVIGRARPIDDGTPTQMTAIERALALLSQPITNIEEIVNEALSFTGDTFDEMQEQLDADQAAYESSMNSRATAFEAEIRSDIADVEHDFDVLNGQYQTAVSALTVDSEVQNVRVGDDGVTYASAGEAVRTQFSNLKSDLGVKLSLGRPTDLNTVTARGVYNLYNQTATNGYTNVPSTWAVGTGAILFVDTGNATGVTWQIFIDTVGNVSTRRYANSAWASWNNPNADLEATVEVVKDGLYPIGNLIANSYADGFDSGAFKSVNGFSRTDYIPCDGFDSLYFDGYATNIQNYCCFYDSNKAFISTFASRSNQGGNISIPKTASYVVVSAQTATMQTVKASFRFLRARKDVNGGNWIFIGDSYLDGYTPDGGVDSWGVKLASFMGLDSDKYVISAKGGAGFYAESDGINFKTLLQGVTAFEKDSVTNIVVCGGYNDNTQTATNIYNAVTTFLTKAKELYPSALVSVGMVGYNSASPGIRNNLRYNSLYAYQEAVGNAPNARYLPLVEYALNNSLMSSDGIHPNANGQVQIAIAVKNALTGSSGLFYYKRLPQTITITGTTSANGEIAIAETVASQNVLSVRYTTGSGFALYRNDGYVVCFDENMQPKANTSVSIEVTYM